MGKLIDYFSALFNKLWLSIIAILIWFTSSILFCGLPYFLIVQILNWIKTAKWEPITTYQSLVDIHIIDPFFYFDFPNLRGIEKILNWLLFSPAAMVCVYLGLIFLYLGLFLYKWWENYYENKSLKLKDSINGLKNRD